jgi:hypothetical protein
MGNHREVIEPLHETDKIFGVAVLLWVVLAGAEPLHLFTLMPGNHLIWYGLF